MIKRTKILLVVLMVIVIVLVITMILSIILKCPTKEEKELPKEVYGLSGTITSIEENALWMDAIIIFADGTNKIEPRKILINENTAVTKLEFPEISPEDRNKPIEPTKVDLEISDLEVGNKIEALSKENIQGKTEFLAWSINVIK